MLVRACAGLEPTARGQVVIDGADVRRSPELRRRIGALASVEPSDSGDVVGVAARALKIRGRTDDVRPVLSRWGLGHALERSIRSLDDVERRRLALALALSIEAPLLLALFEPFSAVEAGRGSELVATLEGAALDGAIVVCATSSAGVAARLARHVRQLHEGVLGQPVSLDALSGVASAAGTSLVVECDRARELSGALAGDPAVSGIEWAAASAPNRLRLSGADLDALSMAVVRHAVRLGTPLTSMGQDWPPLEALYAAQAGSARAAYERAYYGAWHAAHAASPAMAVQPAPPGAPR